MAGWRGGVATFPGFLLGYAGLAKIGSLGGPLTRLAAISGTRVPTAGSPGTFAMRVVLASESIRLMLQALGVR